MRFALTLKSRNYGPSHSSSSRSLRFGPPNRLSQCVADCIEGLKESPTSCISIDLPFGGKSPGSDFVPSSVPLDLRAFDPHRDLCNVWTKSEAFTHHSLDFLLRYRSLEKILIGETNDVDRKPLLSLNPKQGNGEFPGGNDTNDVSGITSDNARPLSHLFKTQDNIKD